MSGGPGADPGPPSADHDTVADLLGRRPLAAFEVVSRRSDGTPVVIENAPFLVDGTPMPTLFWLVDPALREAVSRLEAEGGVRLAEREVDPEALRAAHERYARQREARIDPAQRGPRPSGGVGGTRAGVKCLHAHLAWWLVGDPDPVGAWVAEHLADALERLGIARNVLGDGDGPALP